MVRHNLRDALENDFLDLEVLIRSLNHEVNITERLDVTGEFNSALYVL